MWVSSGSAQKPVHSRHELTYLAPRLQLCPCPMSVDMSPLSDDWTSKTGKWAASTKALNARAQYVRRWLRERPEDCIVLVAHGDINRNILYGERTFVPWANTEVKKLTFKDASGQDEDALLEEIKTEAKEGGDEPTSSEKL